MTRKTAHPVKSLIAKAQTGLLNGDDTAAKLAVAVGAFIVSSDMGYRVAGTKIDIDMPEWSDFVPRSTVEAATLGSGLATIGAGVGFIGVGYYLYRTTQRLIPKLDVQVGTGLWDWEITACGMGLISAGLALYLMNHPELIEAVVTGARDSVTDVTELLATVTTSASAQLDQVQDMAKSLVPLAAAL